MMSRKVIKVICIIMAALMILSVGAVVLQVFAADTAMVAASMPKTGDGIEDYIIPAGIAVAAIIAIVVCLVLPKMKKNDEENAQEKEASDGDK